MIRKLSFPWKQVFCLLALTELVAGVFSGWGRASAGSLDGPGDGLRFDTHEETGKVSFIGADPAAPYTLKGQTLEGLSPQDQAMVYLKHFGEALGLRAPERALQPLGRPRQVPDGRRSVRYQQVYQGIPVLAGEFIVNLDGRGRMLSISGEVSPDLTISIEPRLTREEGRAIALGAVAKWYRLEVGGLRATDPQLWVFDERLLRASAAPATLVWRTEVAPTRHRGLRELVLVDAQTGKIALHFNQVDASLERHIYDNENDESQGLPGKGPVRSEGEPPTGVPDVDLAYDYLGDTYSFYFDEHGRDSLDDAGMPLIATVRYCDIFFGCPMVNAFWDGEQMAFGEGFAVDDVVGHELTHGVTERTSRLFYFEQSGAINESLSDLWGEFIDQLNGGGTDTPEAKWQLGEDIPGLGAIRDMSDPPRFGDPDRVGIGSDRYGDGNYYCGSEDGGGVHANSGVNNKAAYLMVEGGTFNGHAVTGIGISKVADLYYEAQTALLTSGSDYKALYDALIQASYNLGFTPEERGSVQNALLAVEMNRRPCGDPEPAPVCPAGQANRDLFFDDLEDPERGLWVHSALVGVDRWYYPQNPNEYSDQGFDATNARSGVTNFWGDAASIRSDQAIAMTSDVGLPEAAFMHFYHHWRFEYSTDGVTFYDGGVVEYSVDGGVTWEDGGDLIIDNGYNGVLTDFFDNPLGVRPAFTATSHGYTASRLDLSRLAGQKVRFRFRLGTDVSVGQMGWFIDDVRIYTCTPGAFQDVPPSHWAFDVIEALYEKKYIAGCGQDPLRYCPERGMTRAEAAVFVVRGVHDVDYDPPEPEDPYFVDVVPGTWYANWVEVLWKEGYTTGCDYGEFCPHRLHTRAEATVFFLRMLRGTDYVPGAVDPERTFVYADVPVAGKIPWFTNWVYAAYDGGLVDGCEDPVNATDDRYRPREELTRAEAACMMARAVGLAQ